jgi:hypothetical protein
MVYASGARDIELEAARRSRQRAREAAERAARPSRLEVQLDRAREFQRLLDSAEVRNRAELARRFGISRASVTQVMGAARPRSRSV